MLQELLATFTDRREAIALFEAIRHREPNQEAWPLLPVLAFLAPGGSGKSLLIQRLIEGYCLRADDGGVQAPYAYLDFSKHGQPQDLLSILIEVRDQLHQHADTQGRCLTFPRFDLGAAIAQASPLDSQLPDLPEKTVRQKIRTATSALSALNEMGQALGGSFPLIPVFLVALKWAAQGVQKVPGLQEMLARLEQQPTWRWYTTKQAGIGLTSEHVQLSEVLLRLHTLSISSRPQNEGRHYLINTVLPAALLADLLESLDGSQQPHTWQASTPIVLFFDGFEALLQGPEQIGIRVLEVLALSKHRREGKTDPLLLVLGSRRHILEHLVSSAQQQMHQPDWEQQTLVREPTDVQEWAGEMLLQWSKALPQTTLYLRLHHLYLPVWLPDFGPADTQAYLTSIGKQEQTDVFANRQLEKTFHQLTHGHPLYLTLAALSVIEARANGNDLDVQDLAQAPLPASWEFEELQGQQDRPLGAFLLDLLLRQLPPEAAQALTFLALPRAFNAAILQVVLDLASDTEARDRFVHYRSLTLLSQKTQEDLLVLHPIVRTLLLQKVHPSLRETTDYYRLHMKLQAYFLQQGPAGSIEAAYHALALGDATKAIALGIEGQLRDLILWNALREMVAQAPTAFIPETTSQQAYHALEQAKRQHRVEAYVIAIILYTWLEHSETEHPEALAEIQHYLGLAYSDLPTGDRATNLQRTISYYHQVLLVRTQQDLPNEWAMTQNNLGNAYRNLPTGDRVVNLQRAIACFEQALLVFTQQNFPSDWATTQNNLGLAYWNMPTGDRSTNLQRAISCYQRALLVHTQQNFPTQWAMTQNNLGIAYLNLPTGDRSANLQQAISCYQQALLIYTQQDFPIDWATTQNNLGIAYLNLPTGDRSTNLQRAIACYQQALLVRTQQNFPTQWAMTQNNLGIVYSNLPTGDRAANLQQAISCYQQALLIYTQQDFPSDWAATQDNLGTAYRNLPTGDRTANLQRAISCFELALLVRTQQTFPSDWAATQNNLGTAYSELSIGDRSANLQRAISCYELALLVRTQQNFPTQWAMTQNNLGTVYRNLPTGDRAANLQQAISCYELALLVFTQQNFPIDWARTQNNLGNAYWNLNLPAEDRTVNLQRAISCFELALQLFRKHGLVDSAQGVQQNLDALQLEQP